MKPGQYDSRLGGKWAKDIPKLTIKTQHCHVCKAPWNNTYGAYDGMPLCTYCGGADMREDKEP